MQSGIRTSSTSCQFSCMLPNTCVYEKYIDMQVHYHIIPAPTFGTSSEPTRSLKEPSSNKPTMKEMHRLEFESRRELDEDEASVLAKEIRAKIRAHL